MLSANQIVDLHKQRQTNRTPTINRMVEIRDTYEGALVVPLPELNSAEQSGVANLINSGIDQMAARIASVRPNQYWPSVDPGRRPADRRASTRRVAAQGWWDHNRMNLKARFRARYLIAYGSTPVMIRKGYENGPPCWEALDPMSVFAAPVNQIDCLTPDDVIVERSRTRYWLREHGYGEALAQVTDHRFEQQADDDLFTILEYADEYQWSLVCVGRRTSVNNYVDNYGEKAVMLTPPVENPMGMCPLVMPRRFTLGREMGQFDQMLPMYRIQSRLMGLDLAAVEKGIFPDTYLVSRPGEEARIIDGPYDGRSGKLNIVAGGDVKDMTTNPGYQTGPTIDRLERNQRVTAGIPSEFGGESATNIRTGKRGDAVLQGVIDMPIGEAQELLAASMEEENKRAVALEKGLYGGKTRTVYSTGRGTAKQQTYVPDQVFETDQNTVSYPAVGTDLNGLVISMGQRVGIGAMSKRTYMEMDPMVDDPEQEMDRVTAEALNQALLSGIQAQAQSGQIPPADVARIAELVAADRLELADAVAKVQAEAQARQAQAAPPQSPATMPGIAQPGMGAEQPAIGPPAQSQQNLSQLFTTLRRPAMTTPAEG